MRLDEISMLMPIKVNPYEHTRSRRLALYVDCSESLMHHSIAEGQRY